jgi:hypothetical protein
LIKEQYDFNDRHANKTRHIVIMMKGGKDPNKIHRAFVMICNEIHQFKFLKGQSITDWIEKKFKIDYEH